MITGQLTLRSTSSAMEPRRHRSIPATTCVPTSNNGLENTSRKNGISSAGSPSRIMIAASIPDSRSVRSISTSFFNIFADFVHHAIYGCFVRMATNVLGDMKDCDPGLEGLCESRCNMESGDGSG